MVSPARAAAPATVVGNLTDFGLTPVRTNLLFVRYGGPSIAGVSFVISAQRAVQSDADGDFSAPLIPGIYGVRPGGMARDIVQILLTNTSGTVRFEDIITNNLVSVFPALNPSYIPSVLKGAAGGVATLGADGLVPTNQLPNISGDVTTAMLIAASQACVQVSWQIGADGTNNTWGLGANATNFVWALGAALTNRIYQLGAALTNFSYTLAANGTNFAFTLGANGTNFVYSIGANLTNALNTTTQAIWTAIAANTVSVATKAETNGASLFSPWLPDPAKPLKLGAQGNSYVVETNGFFWVVVSNRVMLAINRTNGLATFLGDVTLSGDGTSSRIYTPAQLVFTRNGTDIAEIRSTGINVGANAIGFASSIGSSMDVLLTRDAANTFAQRNGTSAQTFRLYNTYTDASNYERGIASWSGSVFYLGTEKLGTGSARALVLSVNGGNQFQITASGNILPAANVLFGTDNTYDIGASGANRPRNFFLGNDATIGRWVNIGGGVQLRAPSDGVFELLNAGASGFAVLQFGGTTSAFNGISNSAAGLYFVSADGRHRTNIFAQSGNFSGTVTASNVAAANMTSNASPVASVLIDASGNFTKGPIAPAVLTVWSNGVPVAASVTNLDFYGFTLLTNANGKVSLGVPSGSASTWSTFAATHDVDGGGRHFTNIDNLIASAGTFTTLGTIGDATIGGSLSVAGSATFGEFGAGRLVVLSNVVQFAASANHQIDVSLAPRWDGTNSMGQHTCLSFTNIAGTTNSSFEVFLEGSASGGSDYNVTNLVGGALGSVPCLFSDDGAAPATSLTYTVTNGTTLELNGKVSFRRGTNFVMVAKKWGVR